MWCHCYSVSDTAAECKSWHKEIHYKNQILWSKCHICICSHIHTVYSVYITYIHTCVCIHMYILYACIYCVCIHIYMLYVDIAYVYSGYISYTQNTHIPWICYHGQTWHSSSIIIAVASLLCWPKLLVMPPAVLIKKKEEETKKAILLSMCAALGRNGGEGRESLTFVQWETEDFYSFLKK